MEERLEGKKGETKSKASSMPDFLEHPNLTGKSDIVFHENLILRRKLSFHDE